MDKKSSVTLKSILNLKNINSNSPSIDIKYSYNSCNNLDGIIKSSRLETLKNNNLVKNININNKIDNKQNNINMYNKSIVANINKHSNISSSRKALKHECRYCLEYDTLDNLIYPCKCQGFSKYVHSNCLKEWIRYKSEDINSTFRCEVCKHKIFFKFKYKLSFMEAIVKSIRTNFTFNSLLNKIFYICLIYLFYKRLRLIYKDIILTIFNSDINFFKKARSIMHSFLLLVTIISIIIDILKFYLNRIQKSRIYTLTFDNYNEL